MFEVTRTAPNRLDIRFGGKLGKEDMRAALDALSRESAGMENGRMLYRIDDFDLPTLGAIGVELSRLPEMFRMICRFDKAAVLTDTNWVRKASVIEGALIPGLEIKAFDSDDLDDAEAWLAGDEDL